MGSSKRDNIEEELKKAQAAYTKVKDFVEKHYANHTTKPPEVQLMLTKASNTLHSTLHHSPFDKETDELHCQKTRVEKQENQENTLKLFERSDMIYFQKETSKGYSVYHCQKLRPVNRNCELYRNDIIIFSRCKELGPEWKTEKKIEAQ